MSRSIRKAAIIDIGSNSMRLEIFAIRGNDWWLIERHKSPARISQGMYDDQIIKGEAISRAREALCLFAGQIAFHHIKKVRCTATSAIRDAANQREVLEILSKGIPFPIEVLSGEDEAFYSYFGVRTSINIRDGLVFDVGGGSTELIRIQDGEHIATTTLPLGAVRLSESFFRKPGMPSESEWKRLERHIDKMLKEGDILSKGTPKLLIGVGGTVRQLARIAQKKEHYPLIPQVHEYTLAKNQVNKILLEIRKSSIENRISSLGVSKDRADILPAGILIISRILEGAKSPLLTVSQHGLRHGLFMEAYLESTKPPAQDIAKDTISRLVNRFGSYEDSRSFRRILLRLYETIHPETMIDKETKKLLRSLGSLAQTSLSYRPTGDSESANFLLKEECPGFSPQERILLFLALTQYRTHSDITIRKNNRSLFLSLSQKDQGKVIFFSRLAKLAREILLFTSGEMPFLSYAEPHLTIRDNRSDEEGGVERLVSTKEMEFEKGRPVIVIWMRVENYDGQSGSRLKNIEPIRKLEEELDNGED
jgi:exopolyphosphatase/guanosine-5'-triphosphate,3'-diphosphate pyrophosphatase